MVQIYNVVQHVQTCGKCAQWFFELSKRDFSKDGFPEEMK